MELIFLLVLASVSLAVVFLVIFIWATLKGQFDDLETPAHRMLFDESEQRQGSQ